METGAYKKTTTVETSINGFKCLSTIFPKQGPTEITYRIYEKYNENVFESDLREELQKIDPSDELQFI